MKDIYCINILTEPSLTIYEMYLKLSSLFNLKLTHYSGTSADGKVFAGRLGQKGLQKIQNQRYDTNSDIELYELIDKNSKNHLFDMSNLISCKHYKNGYQILIIVEEHNKKNINLEPVMELFIDDNVLNAYCFKYERELLPETVFLGTYVMTIDRNKKRTQAESFLIYLMGEIKKENPLQVPLIFSNTYVKISNNNKLEKICEELDYEIQKFGKGSIILTGKSMRVPRYNKNNRLLIYLAEKGIARRFISK